MTMRDHVINAICAILGLVSLAGIIFMGCLVAVICGF